MQNYKIVVLGDSDTGKTALTMQFCLNCFPESSYRKQAVIDGHPCKIELLDTAGKDEFTALRDQWIEGSEGIILLYSTTSRSTFERVYGFYDQVLKVKDDDDECIPMILVGSKSDKLSEREISKEEGMLMARRLKCDFIETSSRTGINVDRVFYSVIRMIRQSRDGEMIAYERRHSGSGRKVTNCIIT
ncbi:small G-protein Ras2 [Gigaspora margarita]|uniref:Small G-protein Ras2 n=1 Tax=Gigaspora margarita TaxID=4874 RepID=A0A8H4ASV3_GIGMA|nr:small G-protein Ras2 [Gigaspora margarita]